MADQQAGRSSLGASTSYVERTWDSLTDEQLLQIQWFTTDPLSLPHLEPLIPANLGEFQIELEYQLGSEDAAVPCSHCPRHQKHRHGYVLRTPDDRRFLLGSTCGPNAYGSDYRIASSARRRAERRYKALVRWKGHQANLPVQIDRLNDVLKGDLAKAVRRNRASLDNGAPRTLAALRQLRPSGPLERRMMSVTIQKRDLAREKAIDDQFMAEVADLAELPINRREFNERRQAVIDRLGWGRRIVSYEQKDLGSLLGIGWIIEAENPAKVLEDIVSRLRAFLAIGRTTQDKTVVEIERLARDVDAEILRADTLVNHIAEAENFFDPDHLRRLSVWLNEQAHPPCRASATGSTLSLEEGRSTVSLSWQV